MDHPLEKSDMPHSWAIQANAGLEADGRAQPWKKIMEDATKRSGPGPQPNQSLEPAPALQLSPSAVAGPPQPSPSPEPEPGPMPPATW